MKNSPIKVIDFRSMIYNIFAYVFLDRILGSVNLRSFKADKGIAFSLPTKLDFAITTIISIYFFVLFRI